MAQEASVHGLSAESKSCTYFASATSANTSHLACIEKQQKGLAAGHRRLAEGTPRSLGQGGCQSLPLGHLKRIAHAKMRAHGLAD